MKTDKIQYFDLGQFILTADYIISKPWQLIGKNKRPGKILSNYFNMTQKTDLNRFIEADAMNHKSYFWSRLSFLLPLPIVFKPASFSAKYSDKLIFLAPTWSA